LLTTPAPGRYTCHDLLRLYAAERAAEDPAAERAAALERYLRWCMDGVDAAANRLYPGTFRLPRPDEPSAVTPEFPDAAAALSWLDSERANLVAAVVFAAEHGPHPAAWWLADALRRYFWFRESPVDRRTVAAAGLAAAEAGGDVRARAAGHVAMAEWHQIRSDYADAIGHFDDAIQLSMVDGWTQGEATAAGGLANVYWTTGQLRQAAEHAERALALCRSLGSRSGQSSNLGRLGMAYFAMGRLADAASCHRDALAIDQDTANRVNEAYARANLGQAVHAMGRCDEALELLETALAMHRDTGNRLAQGEAHNALAALHRDRGEPRSAQRHARAALEIATALRERRVEADALNRLGDIARGRCDNATALAQYRRAADLAEAAGATCAWVAAQIGLAWALHASDGNDEAAGCADRAEARARAGGYRLLLGLALTARAATLRGCHRPDDARRLARRAMDLHAATGYRIGAAEVERELGRR
jgi:tetratricopeptide (TPR) repeat protein